ncbi:MAG TPA: sulfur carrier protein ThiS [Pirellulales bacterium]|nr:sulfur carrier protein ThiS [Pirellulales bacterium]
MSTPINILINGLSRDVGPGTTIADLLAELDLAGRPVAVEVNLELVPKARHAAYQLREHDCLEVVTLVGGG